MLANNDNTVEHSDLAVLTSTMFMVCINTPLEMAHALIQVSYDCGSTLHKDVMFNAELMCVWVCV